MDVSRIMKDIAASADAEGRSKGSALVILPYTVDYFFERPVVLVDVMEERSSITPSSKRSHQTLDRLLMEWMKLPLVDA